MTFGALLTGLFLGVTVGWLLLRHRVESWARSAFDRWRSAEEAGLRSDALNRSRAVLHGRASEQLAPITTGFPFDPADARFIGSPVDFVVFDGYRDLRAGRTDGLRRIVLVDVKTGGASLTTVQRRVRDCLAEGRYSWHQIGREERARRG